MTLCVAWRDKSGISFASDSRIINPGKGYSDHGIKITSIPVTVYAPHDNSMDNKVVAFQKVYGMCFSGSFLGAFTVREFITSALQRLQYIPGYIPISFEAICRITFKFYRHLLDRLTTELNYDHSIDFFFSGYCPSQSRIRCARFTCDSTPDWQIVLETGTQLPEALGVGADRFRNTLAMTCCHMCSSQRCILHAVKAVILQGPKSVGGPIQYGEFDNQQDFHTLGVMEHIKSADGLLKMQHYFAGIDMNGHEFEPKGDELFIMGKYLTPF